MGMLAERTREATLVCLLFVLLTLVLAAPLSLSPATHALPLSADTRLFLWTISWDVQALLHHPLSLFDANIFFPEPRTLAYSEHILGSAVLGAPALLATGNPVLALNVIVLLSCVLSGLGAYFLARRAAVRPSGRGRWRRRFRLRPAALRTPRAGAPRDGAVDPVRARVLPSLLEGRRRGDLLGRRRAVHGPGAHQRSRRVVPAARARSARLLLCAALRAPAGARRTPAARSRVDGALLLGVNVLCPRSLPAGAARRRAAPHARGRLRLGAQLVSFLASPSHVQRGCWCSFPACATLSVTRARTCSRGGSHCRSPRSRSSRVGRGQGERRARADTATAARPRQQTAVAPSPRWLGVLDTVIVLVALVTLVIHVVGRHRLDGRHAEPDARGRDGARSPYSSVVVAPVSRSGAATPFTFTPACADPDAVRRFVEARVASTPASTSCCSPGVGLGLPRTGYVLYTTLYRLVPGFDLIRVPSRLGVLTLLAVAVLAAVGPRPRSSPACRDGAGPRRARPWSFCSPASSPPSRSDAALRPRAARHRP